MLIDEDGVPIGILGDEARRSAGMLIGFARELHAFRLELSLKLAHICESVELLRVTVPAGIESENILFKHPLKQTGDGIPILQDQPVLRGISAESLETELLVERLRNLEILHSQADRKSTEFQPVLFL